MTKTATTTATAVSAPSTDGCLPMDLVIALLRRNCAERRNFLKMKNRVINWGRASITRFLPGGATANDKESFSKLKGVAGNIMARVFGACVALEDPKKSAKIPDFIFDLPSMNDKAHAVLQLMREAAIAKFELRRDKLSEKAIANNEARLESYKLALEIPQALNYAVIVWATIRPAFLVQLSVAERGIERAVNCLPLEDFVNANQALGWGSLAAIIGEADDLHNYPDASHKSGPACLWKRLGLGVMPDGRRQGGFKKTDTAAEKQDHGYSPRRRSVMYMVTDAVIKGNQRFGGDGRLYKIYADYKARIAAANPPKGAEGHRIPAHIDKMAHRYLAKRILKEFWQFWRDNVNEGTVQKKQLDLDTGAAEYAKIKRSGISVAAEPGGVDADMVDSGSDGDD